MAATTTTCQGIWIGRLLSEITNCNIKPPVLYLDNKSALDLAKNPVFHGRSKHIDTRFHFIIECIENGEVTIEHVSTNKQHTYILSKSMVRTKVEKMIDLLGVMQVTTSRLRGNCWNNPEA